MTKIIFPFKGERDYVHGPSIFDAISKYVMEIGFKEAEIDMAFRKKILVPNCVLEVRDVRPDDSVIAKVSAPGHKKLILCLSPDPDGAVVEPIRIEYMEVNACKNADISHNKISSMRSSGFSEIETLVALCKKLHQIHFDVKKKWIFSRFKGKIPLSLECEIELRIIKSVGARLTCSEVTSGSERVGEIYFSS